MTNIQLTTLIVAIKILAALCMWFAKNMHKEGVSKLNEVKKETQGLRGDIQDLSLKTEIHNQKLEEGRREFDRIAKHQDEQDERLDNLNEKVESKISVLAEKIDNKHHTLNNRVQLVELKISKLEK